jgi:hypothetical protein
MSTTLSPGFTGESTPPPGPGTKTLSVKNVPHAVWHRARLNALASNLSFGDYVVQLLASCVPLLPAPKKITLDDRARCDPPTAIPPA